MEKIKNAVKNNLSLILAIISALLIVVGVIFIVLGITSAKTTFTAVMFIITALVMILLGCVMVYFILLLKGEGNAPVEPNLFLYDSNSGENMSEDVLDFELVNKRMAFFMSRITPSVKDMWTTNLFANDEAFDDVDELKTLLAYKMLYDLADKDIPGLWNLYLNADAEIIESIADYIEANGDEFGKYIIKLHSTASGSFEKSRKFLMDNKAYLESKMFNCAKNNIEKF
ncbi:MAG: hypothetical protein E7667_03125 [Ruminococcaceae bacterium]|nr:hypothetical protein [Oscillospiraceae bacterium]